MNRRNNKILLFTGLLTAILFGPARGQSPSGAAITNTAYASYDGGAGTVLTVPSDTVVTPVSEGLLSILKTALASRVSLGDTLGYEIKIQNTGTAALANVVIADSLPHMLSFVRSNMECGTEGGVVEWRLSEIAAGETVFIQLTCRVVKSTYTETIENRITCSSKLGPPRLSKPSRVRWLPWSEAELEKSVTPLQAFIGDTLTFKLRAANIGPAALTHVEVRDTLPDGIEFISSSIPVETEGRIVLWRVGSLDPWTESLIDLKAVVTPAASGDSLNNRAFLSSAETEPRSSAASTTFRGQGVGLELIKFADDSVYTAGDTITYNLVLRNAGVRAGRIITVTDTLPAGLDAVNFTHAAVIENRIVTWVLNLLKPGFEDTLRVMAEISPPIEDGTRIENRAWARSTEGSQDSSESKIRVISKSGFTLEKTVHPSSGLIGDTLTYILSVRNTGTTRLTGVQLTDSLPHGLEWLDSDASPTVSGNVLTWGGGDLEYREAKEFSFRTVLSPGVSGDSIRNTAHASSGETEPTASSASIRLLSGGPGLEIVNQAPRRAYMAGDTLTYDMILSNGIPRPHTRIVVRDTLPADLQFIGSTHGGQCLDGRVVWDLFPVEPGYHDTLRVTAAIRVPIENQTPVENTVWAYSSAGPQDSSRWNITVTSLPRLVLEILGPETAFPGDTIRYTLIYSNRGTATAFEPSIRDTLPDYLDFVNASGSHSFDPSSRSVHWQLPPLIPGDGDTLYLDARFAGETGLQNEIVNSAWLSCRHSSMTTNVTCGSRTAVQHNNLFIYKTVDRPTASGGDTLTYSIRYGVLGQNLADPVRLTDELPREIRLVSESILCKPSMQFDSYDPVTNRIHFLQEMLNAGERDSIILKAVVLESSDSGMREIENRVMISTQSDTALSSDDPRTRAKTRLVRPFISVKKSVNRKVAEAGEALTYTVTIENKSADTPLASLLIRDLPPEGFRFQEGTSRLDSARIPDPEIRPQGKRGLLVWSLHDTLPPGRSIQLKYRLIVGLSVQRGERENLASALGRTFDGIEIRSDEARVSVLISRGAFDENGLIIGKVYEDLNRNGMHDAQEPQFKNIELILEDGTRVRTDEFGKFSIPDVEPGQHVLRLNERTLPKNKKVTPNEFGFLDDSKSRIVLVPPGGMVKANFSLETIE